MRFKYETIPSDIEFSASSSVGSCVVTLVYDSSKGKVLARGLAPVSGTTAPSNALFYDVTNNIVKNYTTADGLVGQNYSFPFAYVKATSSVYTEISYVCNGFGYMGQVVWSDKGVKCLIPNGLNSDGTFSNLEYTFANVYLTNLEGQASALCFLGKPTNNSTAINSKMSIRRWTVERYFEQNVPPSFSGNYCKWYNTAENKMYTTSDAGVTWSEESTIYLGTLFKTDSSNIEKFIPARPISLMTREFVERKLSNGLFYSMSINGRSGYIEFFTTAEKNQRAFLVQWGKTSVNANTSLSLYKAYSNTNYLTLATPSMNDIEKYVHCQAFAVSTTGIKISIRSNGGNDTSEEVCWFTIGV